MARMTTLAGAAWEGYARMIIPIIFWLSTGATEKRIEQTMTPDQCDVNCNGVNLLQEFLGQLFSLLSRTLLSVPFLVGFEKGGTDKRDSFFGLSCTMTIAHFCALVSAL